MLTAVAGGDLLLQASSLTWSRSIGALFALAILAGVSGHYYASAGWRRVLLAAALAFFIAGLMLGEWTTGGSFPVSLPY